MKVLKVPWDCSLLPQNMDLMIEYESSCCSAFQDHYRSVHEIFMAAGLRRCFFSLEGLSRESYRRYRGRRRWLEDQLSSDMHLTSLGTRFDTVTDIQLVRIFKTFKKVSHYGFSVAGAYRRRFVSAGLFTGADRLTCCLLVHMTFLLWILALKALTRITFSRIDNGQV